METLKELYRIGPGPSSSHTLAPQNACKLFMERFDNILSFDAELFGSLALTGEGHSTDQVIKDAFAPRQCRITFNAFRKEKFPNGLILRGYDEFNNLVANWTVFSLGGGAFSIEEEPDLHAYDEVYPHNNMEEILKYCSENKIGLADYAFKFDKEIDKYLNDVLSQMLKTVSSGLSSDGVLPGRLNVKKVARSLHVDAQTTENKRMKESLSLSAYAYAACEENASGHTCVTAPTMGASGVIAALMYYFYHDGGISRSKLVKALAVGGLFGNVVKKNATLSGAIGGCQAEVGTACAMGSAIVSYLNGDKNDIIAYAAEIGMEHNLGLTCDPVGGYVIIPCIERNATATLRCIDNALLAHSVGKHKTNKVSFDDVVKTMHYTGKKIPIELKETSLGGLATEIKISEPSVLSRVNKNQQVEINQEKTIEEKFDEIKIVNLVEETKIIDEVEDKPIEAKTNALESESHQEDTIIEPVIETKEIDVSKQNNIEEITGDNLQPEIKEEKDIVSELKERRPYVADFTIQDIQLEKTGEFKLSDLDLDLVLSKRKL